MNTPQSKILVTAATGQLGRLVIDELLKTVPPSQVFAAARNAKAAADLTKQGVTVRIADYDNAASWDAALSGIDKVLLISSNAIGTRVTQHRNVIEAARRAKVSLLAYTSILRADTSPMQLALEHRATEAAVRESGVPFALLRNGWYTENYVAKVPSAIEHGVVFGSTGDGRISSAARADYAAAAAAVLTATESQAGKVYELAGDEAYTLADFAAEVTKQSGRAVTYQNLDEPQYKEALIGVGFPEVYAALLAESDAKAAQGSLFDNGHQLSALIGRRTTPLAKSVAGSIST